MKRIKWLLVGYMVGASAVGLMYHIMFKLGVFRWDTPMDHIMREAWNEQMENRNRFQPS